MVKIDLKISIREYTLDKIRFQKEDPREYKVFFSCKEQDRI